MDEIRCFESGKIEKQPCNRGLQGCSRVCFVICLRVEYLHIYVNMSNFLAIFFSFFCYFSACSFRRIASNISVVIRSKFHSGFQPHSVRAQVSSR